MRIRPTLFDWNNLAGPQWVVPQLSQAELQELAQAIVMFIGHDPSVPHRTVVLGSGFIVGVADTLVVATASHIFTWWADQLRPPRPHGLRGLQGDRDDMMDRLQTIIRAGGIAACVTPRQGLRGLILPIVGLAINSDPRDLDAGFVQLAKPPDLRGTNFTTIPMDADPFSFHEPVLMAGYVGGGRELSIGERPLGAGFYEQQIAVRAGRVAELVAQPDGHRAAMYRVNIPSLPGMSGGPLITLRQTPHDSLSLITAVGVVSSSRLGSPILLDHCEEGETWVSPVMLGFGRKVSIDGKPATISDAIHSGTIQAYGERARRFEFIREEADGVAATSFRERSDPNAPE